ncbi:hypothetical protein [Micromonospora aurantiaca (nom. illeg.)]|uniref:hypothetical protein n=1 Tax=Micromonospora aurantiaca (nom. illeg.) TaxID=47850 RepID=UPI003F4A4598
MSEDTMDATAGLIARLDAAETEAGVVRLRHRSYELLDLSPAPQWLTWAAARDARWPSSTSTASPRSVSTRTS